jgi:hypothetical protein
VLERRSSEPDGRDSGSSASRVSVFSLAFRVTIGVTFASSLETVVCEDVECSGVVGVDGQGMSAADLKLLAEAAEEDSEPGSGRFGVVEIGVRMGSVGIAIGDVALVRSVGLATGSSGTTVEALNHGCARI